MPKRLYTCTAVTGINCFLGPVVGADRSSLSYMVVRPLLRGWSYRLVSAAQKARKPRRSAEESPAEEITEGRFAVASQEQPVLAGDMH